MKNYIKYILIIFIAVYTAGCGKSDSNSGLDVNVNRAPAIQLSHGEGYVIELIISGAANKTVSETFVYSETYAKTYPVFEFDAEGAISIRVNILSIYYDTYLIASGITTAILKRGQTTTVNLTIDQTGSYTVTQEALTALQNGNWQAARDSFALAISLNQANYDAHLGYVATNLALLVDTDIVQSLLKDIWDVYGADLKINPLDPNDTVPSSRDYLDPSRYAIQYSQNLIKQASKAEINATRLQSILYGTILPQVESSITSINTIINNSPYYYFEITSAMTPDPYDEGYLNDVLYVIDRPALEAIKSILSVLKGVIYYTCSYNWDMDDYSDTNFDSIQTKAQLTSRYPDLGKLKVVNYMANFRQAFIDALVSAKTAMELAKTARDNYYVGPEKLYNIDDISEKEFNYAKNAIDTALLYVRDNNALTGNDRIDIDFDGTYETVYPHYFFTRPIADMKALLPDVFDTDIQAKFSFNKTALDFMFSNLSDAAFNKFKRNINIKHFSVNFMNSSSFDIDEDGIADLSVGADGSIFIEAAQNKKVIELEGKMPVAINTIDFTDASQEISLSTTNDPQMNGYNYNIKLIGFQTSTGLYGVARILYAQSEGYYYFVVDAYINIEGANQFWNHQRAEQFAVYGRNDMTSAYSDTYIGMLRKGISTPEALGWQLIGNYTVGAEDNEILVESQTAYKNFLIVTTKDSYVILCPQMQMIYSYPNHYSNCGNVLTGGTNSPTAILYQLFDAEYLVDDMDNNFYQFYQTPVIFNYFKTGFFNEREVYGLFSIYAGYEPINEITIYLLKENLFQQN